MLELNKEYTYKQICETLGWKVQAGNSKIAQINEIEDAYEFYHPINKKTHKEKKSYIFTKKLRDLVKPSKANSAGNNCKNIELMINYLLMKEGVADGKYHSWTSWYCDELKVLDRDVCTIVYQDREQIEEWCKVFCVNSLDILCEYVSTAKKVLKKIFLGALSNMEKNNLIKYDKAYHFIYKLGEQSQGHIYTNELNEKIIEYETEVCNMINKKHRLSKKIKDRQLLMIIYSRKDLVDEFKELMLVRIMKDKFMIDILNYEIKNLKSYILEEDRVEVGTNNPILSYNEVVSIDEIDYILEPDNRTAFSFNKHICTLIDNKVRKELINKHYTNKYTKEVVYPFENCEADMLRSAELLFKYWESDNESFEDEEEFYQGEELEDEELEDEELEEDDEEQQEILINNNIIDLTELYPTRIIKIKA